MLSRDAPVITNRRLQRVEQIFGFRKTERRNLLTRFTASAPGAARLVLET